MRLFSILLAIIMMSCTTVSASIPKLSSVITSSKVSKKPKYAKLKSFVNEWARGFESFFASKSDKTVRIEILEYVFLNNSRQAVIRTSFTTIGKPKSIVILVMSKNINGEWFFVTLAPISTGMDEGGQNEEL